MENIHDVTRVKPRAVTQTKSVGKDRRIYTWAAIGATLLVVIGFSRTYYPKQIFGTPSLNAIVHFHGLIMTAWIALFIVQVRLVAVRRTNWHRRLGFLIGASTSIGGRETFYIRRRCPGKGRNCR